MEKIYNKLVRDNIPEIIIKNGDTPITRILTDDEYISALEDKLKEEYIEVIGADSKEEKLEELADMLELIRSIAHYYKEDLDKIIGLMENKKKKRGAFNKKIMLEKTINN